MMTRHDPLISEYLSRLRAETADLPPDEREELVSNIAEHIATSLAELPQPTDAEVGAVLDRLGPPAAIAAEARSQSSGRAPAMAMAAQPDKPGLLEWGGVVMLGVGSYLIPIIGTVAGLVMISLSRWWTTPQKVLAATLSLVGVVIVPLFAAAVFLIAPAGSGAPQPVVSVEVAPTPAPSS